MIRKEGREERTKGRKSEKEGREEERGGKGARETDIMCLMCVYMCLRGLE